MLGSSTLYLWILAPVSVFAIFVGSLVLMGLQTRNLDLRYHRCDPEDTESHGRSGPILNVRRCTGAPEPQRPRS